VHTQRSFKSLLTGVQTEHLKTKATYVFDSKLCNLRQVSDKLLVGLYKGLMGQLDPHLVSTHELPMALDGLAAKAKAVGLKLAPVENDFEVLFSLPITTMLKDGALHLWLTVPLISVDSPIFDIFSVTHEPVPHKGLLFGLAPRKPYFAVDARRQLHLNFDEADLNACMHHRNYYLCDWTTFTTKTDSCSIALFRGEKNRALELCKRIVAAVQLLTTATAALRPPQGTVFWAQARIGAPYAERAHVSH